MEQLLKEYVGLNWSVEDMAKGYQEMGEMNLDLCQESVQAEHEADLTITAFLR